MKPFSQPMMKTNKSSIPIDKVEWEIQFLTKKQEIWTLFFEDEPINIILPPTVELEVKETDPGLKAILSAIP